MEEVMAEKLSDEEYIYAQFQKISHTVFNEPLTDAEREKFRPAFTLLMDRVLAGLRETFAEGRKRAAEESEAKHPELKTLIPEMVKGEQCWIGHGAALALYSYIEQCEEAAARQAWKFLVDVFGFDFITPPFDTWWKQRREGKR